MKTLDYAVRKSLFLILLYFELDEFNFQYILQDMDSRTTDSGKNIQPDRFFHRHQDGLLEIIHLDCFSWYYIPYIEINRFIDMCGSNPRE